MYVIRFVGHKSWRDKNEGSWFIQTFCQNLCDHAGKQNLDFIIRRTQFQVAQNLGKDENNNAVKQVPDKKCDSLGKILMFCPQGISI